MIFLWEGVEYFNCRNGVVSQVLALRIPKNVSNQIIVEQNVVQSFSSLCTNTICELVNNFLQQIMIQKCVYVYLYVE